MDARRKTGAAKLELVAKFRDTIPGNLFQDDHAVLPDFTVLASIFDAAWRPLEESHCK